MSRGIGTNQRKALIALWEHEEGIAAGVPLAELKRSTGADRSNARRAIRGLIERGLAVEFVGDDGERRVKLTGGAHMALWLATEFKDEPLSLERVPGRPLNLDLGDDPLGSAEPSWFNADAAESPVRDNAGSNLALDTPMSLGKPHEPSPLPPDRPVSDNAPSSRGRGDAMQTRVSHANAPLLPDRGVSDHEERTPGRGYPMPTGIPHANMPRTPDRGVNDNVPHVRGLAGEIAARMAREWLARLDAEAAEEGEV